MDTSLVISLANSGFTCVYFPTPFHHRIMCEKLLRTVNRYIAKPRVKVQLLALSVSDTASRAVLQCHVSTLGPTLLCLKACIKAWSRF